MSEEIIPTSIHIQFSNPSDMGHERYKFVVQVIIGEQRGEGVK